MYAYAPRLNFSGKKEYPFTSSVFSSVIDDMNSSRKGTTTVTTTSSITALIMIW